MFFDLLIDTTLYNFATNCKIWLYNNNYSWYIE